MKSHPYTFHTKVKKTKQKKRTYIRIMFQLNPTVSLETIWPFSFFLHKGAHGGKNICYLNYIFLFSRQSNQRWEIGFHLLHAGQRQMRPLPLVAALRLEASGALDR